MRKSVFLFNPDHDLALANHDVNYMPPASARQLASDLALFPVWYAGLENAVLAASAYNYLFLNEIRLQFPQLASLLTEAEIAMAKEVDFIPWGWDPAVYKRFLQLGASPRVLPGQEQLDTIREKSHRLQAVRLLEQLQFDCKCGESFYLTELSAIKTFVESRTSCLLKAPLSGSGKGLNWCKGAFTTHIRDWCRNIIRQQGGIVAEPSYDKDVDFAMQFYADKEGMVRFTGYSLFRTCQTGAYNGNLLATDNEVEKRLINYIPLETLRKLRDVLEGKLSELLEGAYVGYLGVDMMICRPCGILAYRLHPCVEINLRMNMGMSSRLFYDNYVQYGKRGMLQISYFSSNNQLQEEHKRMKTEHPLKLHNERIVEGYMPLVPITPRAQYAAWVLIGESMPF